MTEDQKKVTDLDPFDPNLTPEQKELVLQECRSNPEYFLENCVRKSLIPREEWNDNQRFTDYVKTLTDLPIDIGELRYAAKSNPSSFGHPRGQTPAIIQMDDSPFQTLPHLTLEVVQSKVDDYLDLLKDRQGLVEDLKVTCDPDGTTMYVEFATYDPDLIAALKRMGGGEQS